LDGIDSICEIRTERDSLQANIGIIPGPAADAIEFRIEPDPLQAGAIGINASKSEVLTGIGEAFHGADEGWVFFFKDESERPFSGRFGILD
jgi:hypothetical protein